MHKIVAPKTSGVHRFACLALYRALLRQCPAATHAPWLAEVRHHVKQRFHRYKELESPSQVTSALQAGYNTLDLLDSASKGNQKHEDQIKKTLSDAKSLKDTYAALQRQTNKPKPQKPLSQRDIRKQEAIRHEEETQQRKPNTSSILSRPHMGVKDRKVPVLVNARGIPFLRLKKPQPKNLSGVIRAKLEKRWDRIVLRDRLQVDLLFAEDEEAWDKLTNTGPKDRTPWTKDVKSALNDVCARIVETDRDNRDLSEKMWNIVLQERELVSKEKHNREQVNQLQ